METNDLITKIQINYPSFTRAEKHVADFILENPRKVLYMSITDLADASKVGDTSVFRFCRTLRFDGYQKFKMSLAQDITALDGKPQEFSGEIEETDSFDEVLRKVLHTHVSALNETYEQINKDDISLAVQYLVDARKVVFFGVGSSLVTAMEATDKFMRITDKMTCTIDSHQQTMTASLLKKEDAAVIISFSGSTRDCVDIAKICRQNGVKVICITRFGKSPLTRYSDLTLLLGANEHPLQGGSITARISQLFLLDILYIEYFRKTYQESGENRKKTSASVADKLY